MDPGSSTKAPALDPHPPSAGTAPARPKRSKTSKACNACRKQKSRCERLAGDAEGCHRCGVIGIACVFETDGLAVDKAKLRRPRPILPRSHPRPGARASPDNTGLHVLANTTALIARHEGRLPISASSSGGAPSSRVTTDNIRKAARPKTPLSPETLSSVESTLFPAPRDSTQESELARFRADWRRWVAPLTLLQKLVRRCHVNSSLREESLPPDVKLLTPAEEKRLKDHFQTHYSPWLPAVRLGQGQSGSGPGTLDAISPFLATVMYATAARTLGTLPAAPVAHLRSLALHHVGQVFASPAAYPLVDSLYALLVLVLWPLDAADDVALLVHGAKRLASSHDRGAGARAERDGRGIDHIRLWYAICANETMLTLGAGSVTTAPALDDLGHAFGSASELALSGGYTSDVLIILQTNLHGIITAAIGERGQHAGHAQDNRNKDTPSIPRGRQALLNYVNMGHMYLTRLGEWEIEFYTISSECNDSEAAYYAVLEIEYHYLLLTFVTHCILTLCHACSLDSAPDEIKAALWSWSITGNKSAHAVLRLFNAYAHARSHAGHEHDPTTHTHLPPLALAPDRIFAMVVLSVMLILRHQVASHEYGLRRGLAESPPAGFTKQAELAIRKAIERMAYIGHVKEHVDADGRVPASAYDHAASRYVDILEALFRIWGEKRAERVASAGVAAPGTNGCFPAAPGSQSQSQSQFQAHHPRGSGADGSGADGPPAMPHPHPHTHTHAPETNNVHHDGAGTGTGTGVQLDLDLSLLSSDLFCDTAASFTWDGVGTLDWGGAAQ